MRWLAVVVAAAVAAAPAAQAGAARKKHRVTPAHRLAKKAPKHKGVTFQRPRVIPLPTGSPVPQGATPQPTATPAPTATPTPPPPTETRTGIDLDDRNDQLVMRLTPYKVLKAGTIELVPFNLGEDEHNLTVKSPSGATLADIPLPAGGDAESVVLENLPAGDYYLFCNIADHAKRGMNATLTLR